MDRKEIVRALLHPDPYTIRITIFVLVCGIAGCVIGRLFKHINIYAWIGLVIGTSVSLYYYHRCLAPRD